MVNLRKVGAIATGALFVGATLGMAAAVTVPSDFKASMLADQGVAKAQLVVGANAPGKTADEASAKIIADAAKAKLTYTVAGGDIAVKYGSKKWDDGTTGAWLNGTGTNLGADVKSTNSSVDGKIINASKGSYGYLRIDKNADGDSRTPLITIFTLVCTLLTAQRELFSLCITSQLTVTVVTARLQAALPSGTRRVLPSR